MKVIFVFLCQFYFVNFLKISTQLNHTDSLQFAFNSATSDIAKLSILLKNRYTKYLGQPNKAQGIQNQLFTISEKAARRGTTQEKGQGLGVMVAKVIVEADKGALKIESVENQGTTVHLELPS